MALSHRSPRRGRIIKQGSTLSSALQSPFPRPKNLGHGAPEPPNPKASTRMRPLFARPFELLHYGAIKRNSEQSYHLGFCRMQYNKQLASKAPQDPGRSVQGPIFLVKGLKRFWLRSQNPLNAERKPPQTLQKSIRSPRTSDTLIALNPKKREV